jgi:hypothetical protein
LIEVAQRSLLHATAGNIHPIQGGPSDFLAIPTVTIIGDLQRIVEEYLG